MNGEPLLTPLHSEASSLWDEAVQAVEVRERLSVAYTGEKGLIVPMTPPNGRASEMLDPNKLRELNDHTVALVRRLSTLLDDILLARTRKQK